MENKLLVYGATGYTGKLFVRELLKNHLQPVLAGRSENVASLAAGVNCEHRIFTLDDYDAIDKNIQDIQLVANIAGPFHVTQNPLIQSCIQTGTHYIDIAGEVPEMESAFMYDQQAKDADIMIMPGAGFGVVPTDIAASLAKRHLPDSTWLKIAYATEGGASRGTLKTILQDVDKPGFIRKNGKWKQANPASNQMEFNVKGKQYTAVYNPWRADLFTAYVSTLIPNIETYTVFPGIIVKMMQGKMLWLRDFILKYGMKFLPAGPSERSLNNGSTIIHAKAGNNEDTAVKVNILGPEAYLFTVKTLLSISERILNGQVFPGTKTPSIYGRELIEKICEIEIIN
ncbi:MAG: hypothetical protein GF372_11270 [Candidatus Marinimicrobia bacterium]|nr:hypothetical protein [Candidatus Neomarinimicrobiota bacterium]